MTDIDFDRIPVGYPTLCIPRALSDFCRGSALTKGDVARTFEQLNIGKIGAIQIEDSEDPKFCRIFVHFVEWYRTPLANKARDRVLQGETIKVVYYKDNFWKAMKSKFDELKPDKNRSNNNKPRLILDDEPRRRNDDRRSTRRPEPRQRPRPPVHPPSDKLEDALSKLSISEERQKSPVKPRSPACSPPRSRPVPKEEGECDDEDYDPDDLYSDENLKL